MEHTDKVYVQLDVLLFILMPAKIELSVYNLIGGDYVLS